MALVAVDHDPFAQQAQQLVPVDHDPFAEQPQNNQPQSVNPNASPVGIMGSIGQGIKDLPMGIAQAGLHAAQYIPDEYLPNGVRGADKVIDQTISNDESNYQQGRKLAGRDGFDYARMVGGIAGSAPLAGILPEAEGGLLAKGASGAAQGGLFGAINPTTGNNYGDDKLSQIETSAGLGGFLSPLIHGISGFVSPNVSDQVKGLMKDGVTPTMGQILGGNYAGLEEKLSSIPFVGGMIKNAQGRALDEFNTAALARALAPIGEDAPSSIGREGIQAVKSKLSDAYDSVIPKLSFNATDPKFTSDLSQLHGLTQNLPTQQANQFEKIINTQIHGKLSPTGMMDGQTYKGAVSEIGNAAKGYSSDPSYDNRQLGSALQQAQSLMKQNLLRSNPEYAPQLNAIDQGYANYAILRNAGSKLGANGEQEMGKFTPSQLQSAVRSADKSVGKGNFATGNARMQDLSDAGVGTLSKKYPDSGTAGREMIAALLGSMAEGGGALTGHAVIPAAIGAGMTLPYTQVGQKLAAALLTKRPDMAKPIGDALSNSSKYITSGIAPLMFPSSQAVN